jgi:hypothetical protein
MDINNKDRETNIQRTNGIEAINLINYLNNTFVLTF